MPTERPIDPGYDEFGFFEAICAEEAIERTTPPSVRRAAVEAPSGLALSALVWGTESPEVVLLHGGAQNAHTWDTVLLALDRPAVAIDLPGHGHSDRRPRRDYHPTQMAADVTAVIGELAPNPHVLVGMSLGGLTATVVAADHPDPVRHLALVDITPGVNRDKASDVISFVAGPESFASFDEILARTIEFNPTRSEASLRRGVLHNARERDDGRWEWRYDLPDLERTADLDHRFSDLWTGISAVAAPITLFQGSRSPVVDDDDVAELLARQPSTSHVVVADAGHSIQGDQPLDLAHHLDGLIRSG